MLHDVIRDWLTKTERSGAYLAGRSGLTAAALNSIARGHTRNPRAKTLVRLSKAMGLTLDQLLHEELREEGKR